MYTVGNKIREHRKKANFSGSKLSELSGVSQGAISQIESGSKSPTVATLEKLCRALDIQMIDLFDRTSLPPDLFNLVKIAKQLPPAQREILIQLAQNLLDQKEGKLDE